MLLLYRLFQQNRPIADIDYIPVTVRFLRNRLLWVFIFCCGTSSPTCG